jgi:parallel beta-helix repeat protein
MGDQRTALILLLIVCFVLVSIPQIVVVKAEGRIYIRSDGTVEGTDKIQRNGDVYNFTGDIYGRIDIQKSNIVLDGAGYSLIKSELNRAIYVGTATDVLKPSGVNGITIRNLQISGFMYGIKLGGENNVVERVNITDGPDHNGVPIWVCGSNHKIRECRITDNKGYGMLIDATAVVLSDNYIADNGYFGIKFIDQAATLRNNTLNNNRSGPFYMDEDPRKPFQISSNDIDPSNIVDGKPVYYWVNEQDKTVPPDAGYVVLDNCKNINVKNLSINRNSTGRFVLGSSGISLIRTENATISNNVLNGTGICISFNCEDILVANNKVTYGGIHSRSYNISIVENYISATKDYAIDVGHGHKVLRNILSGCQTGIYLQSDQNLVSWNIIVDCYNGIVLFTANNNTFCQNNFINNSHNNVIDKHHSWEFPLETYYQSFNNTWDGNYWSDYNGTDADGDGIGDTPYIIDENNKDNYPLMNPLDITPPSISIISPQNTTYTTNSINLQFTVDEETSWMGYSLDGQDNITITENTLNLTGLSDGSHSLTVYAADTSGDTGTSETIYFKIDTSLITWVIGIIVIVAVVGAAFLAYFLKIKKATKPE